MWKVQKFLSTLSCCRELCQFLANFLHNKNFLREYSLFQNYFLNKMAKIRHKKNHWCVDQSPMRTMISYLAFYNIKYTLLGIVFFSFSGNPWTLALFLFFLPNFLSHCFWIGSFSLEQQPFDGWPLAKNTLQMRQGK